MIAQTLINIMFLNHIDKKSTLVSFAKGGICGYFFKGRFSKNI